MVYINEQQCTYGAAMYMDLQERVNIRNLFVILGTQAKRYLENMKRQQNDITDQLKLTAARILK